MTTGAVDHARIVRVSLRTGLAGAAVVVIGALFDLRSALRLYLPAAIAWTAIPIGCLPVFMTMSLIGGPWRQEIAGPLIAGCRTLPVAALLFLPVLLGVHAIYPWAGGLPDENAFKAAYLTPWFFILRTVIYFAIWSLLAVLMTRPAAPHPAVSSVGLILYALTASLAGVDWAMSLDPAFQVSSYGFVFVTHQLLAGLAMAVAVAMLASGRPAKTAGLGGLLLSTVLLWAYLQAMQFIIVWAGDLPREIVWYMDRVDGGWRVALWALGLFQGAVPFALLLSSRCRSSPVVLAGISLLILAMRLLEAFWLTVPAYDEGTGNVLLSLVLAIAAVAGAGGLLCAALFYNVARLNRRGQTAEVSHG